MQVIQINSVSGTPPYDVYVCDPTITYCYFVSDDVSVFPLLIDLPIQLIGINSVVVKMIDSNGCEIFYNIACQLPTPSITVTPSYTPTPTPTQTVFGNNCQCIQFDNSGGGEDIGYQYTACNGVVITDTALDGQIICRCGSNPSGNNIKLFITILGTCNSICQSGNCPPGT